MRERYYNPGMATATKPGHIKLTEAISFGPDLESRIDEANGIIKDVKVLGKYSKNGRRYTDPVHDQCIQLAEGATVYRNHPANESNTRQVEERFGVLNGLYKKNGETYARQLKLNTHSSYYKQFLWECRNNPRGIGLSINADGDGKKDRQGILDVTKLYEIYSVDVVDNPATTLTLWEQTMDDMNMVPDQTTTTTDTGGDWKDHLANAAGAVVASLKDGSMTKEQAKAAITKLLEMIDSGKTEEPPESPSEDEQSKMMEAIQRLPFAATKWAANAIRKYKLSERNSKRLEKATAKLPKTLLTEQFIKVLNRAEDNEVDALIADRLVGHNPKQLPRDGDTIKLAEQTQTTGNENKPDGDKNLISSLGAELMGALK